MDLPEGTKLTPEELAAFTGKTARAQKRYGSQERELKALGIPFYKRTDKTLIVDRAYAGAPEPEKRDDRPSVRA